MILTGKSAVVTGGVRGLGKAICLALAQEGADVAVASDVTSENEAVAAEVKSLGVAALPSICPGIANTEMITGPEGTLTRLSEMLGMSREIKGGYYE